MRELARRVQVLEQSGGPAAVLPCFVHEGETPAQAVARRWPENAPPLSRVVFISWLPPQEGSAK